jgi:hypothetical protein
MFFRQDETGAIFIEAKDNSTPIAPFYLKDKTPPAEIKR